MKFVKKIAIISLCWVCRSFFLYSFSHYSVTRELLLCFCLLFFRKSGAKDKKGDLSQLILESNHLFQDYTYKKVTPCDVCSQILRGNGHIFILVTIDAVFYENHSICLMYRISLLLFRPSLNAIKCICTHN